MSTRAESRWFAALAMSVLAAAMSRADAPADVEHLRPAFHFTPARHFMNDPNGLVYYRGEYHLFYQHNPFGDVWGHMSWGHAVSRDLLHWERLPVALEEADGVMIFSGSAAVDWHNTSGLCGAGRSASCLVAIYTGDGHGRQTQNLAFSTDRGRTWTKYARNPIIDLGLKDFRDPKLIWDESARRWLLVTVLSDQHKVRFFGSEDLRHWVRLSDFGPEGATGGVWECPDLFPLAVEGERSDVRWVLVVNINPGAPQGGSGAQYFVGSFDGRAFVNDNAPAKTLWADAGKDFYAAQSFSDIPSQDGRRIWMGWISNWLYANEEPTGIWRGAQSIPRALSLRREPDGVRLVQRPVRELDSLRTRSEPAMLPPAGASLPAGAEIEIEVTRGAWHDTGLRLSNAAGENVLIGVTSAPEVFVDRRHARHAPWHAAYPGRHATDARWVNDRLTLRVLFDRSVIEVFVNDGERVLTDRVYPTMPYQRLDWIGEVPPGSHARVWALTPNG